MGGKSVRVFCFNPNDANFPQQLKELIALSNTQASTSSNLFNKEESYHE